MEMSQDLKKSGSRVSRRVPLPASRLVQVALFSILMAAACSLQNRTVKSWSRGGEYEVVPGEELLSWYRADMHTFFSGIRHSRRVLDHDRIVWDGYEKKQLTFTYIREMKDGRVHDYSRRLVLQDTGKRPQQIYLAGFTLNILQVDAEVLRFQVMRELPGLREEGEMVDLWRRMVVYPISGSRPARSSRNNRQGQGTSGPPPQKASSSDSQGTPQGPNQDGQNAPPIPPQELEPEESRGRLKY
jgi:hypothetical protein